MSIEAMQWVFRLGGINAETGGRTSEDYVVNGQDKSVLIVLGNHADERHECWPSTGLIMDTMALGRRNVQMTLNRLEAKGLIDKIEIGAGRHSSRYRMNVGSGYVTERSLLNDERLIRQRKARALSSTVMPSGASDAPAHDMRLSNSRAAHDMRRSGACHAPEPLYNQDSITESESVESPAPLHSVATIPVAPAEQPAAPAASHTLLAADKPKRSKGVSVGSRMTEIWRPDFAGIEHAKAKGLNVEAVIQNFVGYWINTPGQRGMKIRWDLTWVGWCNRDAAEGKNLASGHQATMRGPARGLTPQDDRAAWFQQERARRTSRPEHEDLGAAFDIESTAEEVGR